MYAARAFLRYGSAQFLFPWHRLMSSDRSNPWSAYVNNRKSFSKRTGFVKYEGIGEIFHSLRDVQYVAQPRPFLWFSSVCTKYITITADRDNLLFSNVCLLQPL